VRQLDPATLVVLHVPHDNRPRAAVPYVQHDFRIRHVLHRQIMEPALGPTSNRPQRYQMLDLRTRKNGGLIFDNDRVGSPVK